MLRFGLNSSKLVLEAGDVKDFMWFLEPSWIKMLEFEAQG